MRTRTARLAAIAVVLALAWSTAATAAPKTDVVTLVNGDRVTGEIKSLEHNRLQLSTDNMGTIYIEWDKVAYVRTKQLLMLESADGSIHYGSLVESKEPARLEVKPDESGVSGETLEMATVVRLAPIERGSFVHRLDGYVSAGLNLTKADSRTTLDVAGGVNSRTRKQQWAIDGSVDITNDNTGATTERDVLQAQLRRFKPDRTFVQGFAGLERNTELDLNLRSALGGGYGKYFMQSNKAEWSAGAGLAYSHENYRGGEIVDSIEGVLSTTLSMFRYDFPETDINATVSLLPSLTQSGRYRAQADLRGKYEFINDLYFELRLYGTYDSKPPLADSEKSDYGMVTSLGYTF